MTRPNFLVIMTDRQRWDHLGDDGNRVVQTPLLDTNTYADVRRAASWCTALVGKAHFQNVTNIPAPPRKPRGKGGSALLRARREQRGGAEYGGNWWHCGRDGWTRIQS